MLTICDGGEEADVDGALTPMHDETAFRQLRHLTRNALQRVIGNVYRSELRATAEGRLLVDEVERAICLTAAISDALFGLTRAPGTPQERLRSLAVSLVSLFSSPDQDIELDVRAFDACPDCYTNTVLRAANEFVGNALKHGLANRTHGCIRLHLSRDTWGHTRLLVSDDGWGVGGDVGADGEGLKLARELANEHGGTVALRFGDCTEAEMVLPPPPATPRPARRRRAEMAAIALSLAAMMGTITAAEWIAPHMGAASSLCFGSLTLAGGSCP